MKKLLLLFLFLPSLAWAGCPTNDFLYNTLTPLTFSYEKRDGTGEDTANTGNKRVAISYWNGSAVRWWNGTDWTSTTEQLLTMTQVTGSQYRYNFTPNSTVSGAFLMVRFDETDNVDVTGSCLSFVHPEDRWVAADERGTDNAATASALATAQADLDNPNQYKATGFSTHSAADVWAVGTREITGGTVTTVSDKTGYTLSSAGVDAILDDTIEGSYTLRQVLCILAGRDVGKAAGGATTSITFRNLGDTLNRVSFTTDSSGNRTAVTFNLTGCQ